MSRIAKQAGIFTLGCFYRDQENTKFMSMFGSVTDAQVFSRELTDNEMVEWTTCRSAFLEKDQNNPTILFSHVKEVFKGGHHQLGD